MLVQVGVYVTSVLCIWAFALAFISFFHQDRDIGVAMFQRFLMIACFNGYAFLHLGGYLS